MRAVILRFRNRGAGGELGRDAIRHGDGGRQWPEIIQHARTGAGRTNTHEAFGFRSTRGRDKIDGAGERCGAAGACEAGGRSGNGRSGIAGIGGFAGCLVAGRTRRSGVQRKVKLGKW